MKSHKTMKKSSYDAGVKAGKAAYLQAYLRDKSKGKSYCDYEFCLVRYYYHNHIDEHTVTFLPPTEDRA